MINKTQDEIIKAWKNTSSSDPLVSISCTTYNHVNYIEQCLDGFLEQETEYPFEILIHDDCSTDGATNIIKEYEKRYPSIIKAIYEKENQYQNGKHVGSDVWNLPRAKGKYIAFCEGDDYWTDSQKLQKQVDFLEKNINYGMCYSKSGIFLDDTKRMSKETWGSKVSSFEDLLFNGNRVPTLTVLIRKEIYNNFVKEINPSMKNWVAGDYPLWLYVLKKSKAFFLPEKTAVYRVANSSVSHGNDFDKRFRFSNGIFQIKKFFADYAQVSIKLPTKAAIEYHVCIDLLNEKFCVSVAKKLQQIYKELEFKSKKDKCYYISSYSPVFWSLLKFLIKYYRNNI